MKYFWEIQWSFNYCDEHFKILSKDLLIFYVITSNDMKKLFYCNPFPQ